MGPLRTYLSHVGRRELSGKGAWLSALDCGRGLRRPERTLALLPRDDKLSGAALLRRPGLSCFWRTSWYCPGLHNVLPAKRAESSGPERELSSCPARGPEPHRLPLTRLGLVSTEPVRPALSRSPPGLPPECAYLYL